MDLILWRHAEALDPAPGESDLHRRLTPRGEKQAARVAAWLDRQLPEMAKIWVSPARRAQQTAQALGRKFKTSELLGPQGSAAELLELVQWPQGKGCVLVVGHQPTLGQTLSSLLGLSERECTIRKGALWWLRLRERELGSKTVVVTVQSPEFL
ncbi:MAG: phosphohistidine phosphatase SixA [Burkholderiales bacterium]